MRIRLALAFLAATAVAADAAGFFNQQGVWTVYGTSSACRALNRPPEDFNREPSNAVQITVRAGNAIAIEAFFAPKTIDAATDYRMQIAFAGSRTVSLGARAEIGDYMLVSLPDDGLWSDLAKATAIDISVEGEPALTLHFDLAGMDWVLGQLKACAADLAKS